VAPPRRAEEEEAHRRAMTDEETARRQDALDAEHRRVVETRSDANVEGTRKLSLGDKDDPSKRGF